MNTCDQCDTPLNREPQDDEDWFCSDKCRINYLNNKIKSLETIANQNYHWQRTLSLFIFAGFVLLILIVTFLSYAEDDEQDERLIRWMEHQRDIERDEYIRNKTLCKGIVGCTTTLGNDYHFEWKNPK